MTDVVTWVTTAVQTRRTTPQQLRRALQRRPRARHRRLVVELDGRLGHTGMGRYRDMNRDNPTLLAGEVTLRYGLADVADRSCEVARQVGTMLTRLGRPDLPRSCRFCSRLPQDSV